MPTENGLKLFKALKQADPELVDPGVTATLECLIDDVIVGRQDMTSAIDAVCDVAKRIIENLNQGGNGDGPPLIKPPPGYTKLTSVCRLFLDTHALKKTGMLD